MGLTNWQSVREIFPDFRYEYGPTKQILKMEPPVGSDLYRNH